MKHRPGDCMLTSLHELIVSGHIGLTVPDVKAALARFEKLGVEVFKPLNVATNETIPVPSGMAPLVPGFKEVYNQIAMIRVSPFMSGRLTSGS
jgi:hypothetical protein